MSRNYYQTLGIGQRATDASIRRAAEAAKEQITADTSLSSLERESRFAELQTAAETLLSPAKRDAYDAVLQLKSDPAKGGAAGILFAPTTWMALFAVLVIFGGLYWQYDRVQTRERLERQRIAAEQQEERRAQELEAKRVADKQKLLDELRAQRESDDKQRQESNEIRSAESQKKQYVADERLIQQPQTNYQSRFGTTSSEYEDRRQMGAQAWQQQMEERKQRMEEDANLRRARAEVDRQKRYLEQLERDDQYAKARREADGNQRR